MTSSPPDIVGATLVVAQGRHKGEFLHLRAEPALECGGWTPPFPLNMPGLRMPHR